MTESEVLSILNGIQDPCSVVAGAAAGLVEMGLIRDLVVLNKPSGVFISLLVRVTEPGCLMGSVFAQEASQRLKAIPGVSEVEVKVDHAFDWKPEDMLSDYRVKLEQIRAKKRLFLPVLKPGSVSSPNP